MRNVLGFPDAETIRKEAAGWIAKLDGDDSMSLEERDALRRWIRRSSAHRQAIRDAAELWGSLNILTELAPESIELADPWTKRQPGAVSRGAKWRWFAAAASFVVVLFVGAFLTRENPLLSTNGFYATAVGDQQSVTLADGSVIELNTDTRLRIDYSSGLREVVLLRGEAHFTVAKIDQMPFQVRAGFGQVLAVGTAFSVYLRHGTVDVTVTEGRVSVSANATLGETPLSPGAQLTDPDSVILNAGQVATLKNASPTDVASIELKSLSDRELSRRMLWKNGVLAFSRTPLRDVVAEINRYTTLEIQFSNEAVADIPVIARFPIGDTEMMLEIFESNFDLAVTYTGPNRVLLSAKEETEAR